MKHRSFKTYLCLFLIWFFWKNENGKYLRGDINNQNEVDYFADITKYRRFL